MSKTLINRLSLSPSVLQRSPKSTKGLDGDIFQDNKFFRLASFQQRKGMPPSGYVIIGGSMVVSPTNINQFLGAVSDGLYNGYLAFTSSGSLWNYSNGSTPSPLWISPLAPINEQPTTADIIVYNAPNANNTQNNTLMFTNMLSSTPSQTGFGGYLSDSKYTFLYPSPQTATWLLQVTYDGTSDNSAKTITSINIYYNPLQSASDSDIDANLENYCSLVSYADPTCFCKNGINIFIMPT